MFPGPEARLGMLPPTRVFPFSVHMCIHVRIDLHILSCLATRLRARVDTHAYVYIYIGRGYIGHNAGLPHRHGQGA